MQVFNWISKARAFVRDVRSEIKKVTWPSKKDTLGSTSIVLILVILVAIYLGIVDLGLAKIIGYIFSS